jgi:putative oxidoreductase
VNRTLPAPARDVALLVARLLLGTIMFAHGYQKLMIDGIGRTTQGFETMSIPVAIFSAAFVTVVEIVGGVLVVLGAALIVVAACYLVVMVGAAVFVHIPHGIFVANGGFELVGAIAALLLTLAVAGSGRYGVDGALRARHARAALDAPTEVHPVPTAVDHVPARTDPVARAAAFTEVFARITDDTPAPPLPVRRRPSPHPAETRSTPTTQPTQPTPPAPPAPPAPPTQKTQPVQPVQPTPPTPAPAPLSESEI